MTTTFASTRPGPRAFFGKGLAFPLAVTPQGRLAVAWGEAKVEQSIWLILSTALGERVMRPALGCAAHNELFGPASSATVVRIVDQVRRCLTEQEPRIAVLDVTAELSASDQNVLLIRIDYRLRSNNAMTNLVYPFFIREGV
jgi:phage baseplate assembly protein W